MLGFIKKIFGKPDVKQAAEEVRIEDLEKWLESKTTNLKEEAQSILKSANEAVLSEVETLKQKASFLEGARLMNPNIPERAKHYMEGNRSAYLKKLAFLIEKIKFTEDLDSTAQFSASFKKELKEFFESSSRPYQILNEFFANELKGIVISLKNIERIFVDTGLTEAALKIARANSLKNDALILANAFNQKKELESRIAEKELVIAELDASIKKIEVQIKDLENDTSLNELNSNLKTAGEEISRAESEFLGSFSIFETALKKFGRITFQYKDAVEHYLQNPVNALSTDIELRLPAILDSMKKLIINNEIGLKEKKKEKTIGEINRWTKDALADFLKKYAELKRKEKKLEKEITLLDSFKKLSLLKDQLEKHCSRKVSAENEAAQLKKQLAKKDVPELKQEFASGIRELLNIDIKLV